MTYYHDTCSICQSPARLTDLTDHDHDRTETICLCTNPVCQNFDADNLGPEAIQKFMDNVHELGRHHQQVGQLLDQVRRQADEIAGMGRLKVEAMRKNQKQ